MQECVTVATVLDKALKRQVSVDGVDYMVALDPEGYPADPEGQAATRSRAALARARER